MARPPPPGRLGLWRAAAGVVLACPANVGIQASHAPPFRRVIRGKKHNGEPGWQTIGRGYELLLERQIGYDQGWTDAVRQPSGNHEPEAPATTEKRA